jgi:ribosomal protein L6P/L9E
MSRIGNNPIIIPEGVTIDIQPSKIKVIGKLGELTQDYDEVEIKVNENIFSEGLVIDKMFSFTLISTSS